MKIATNRCLKAATIVGAALWLAACATGGVAPDGPSVGPSSTWFGDDPPPADRDRLPLRVIVPVFDPGFPEDPDDYEKHGIWPELRHAEANRFALNMKHALEDTESLHAVRVTPDAMANGEIFVLGTIRKSNGEDVKIDIVVRDIAGKRLMKETYTHRVKERFHTNLRNKGKDPYAPLFTEAAADIVALLRKKPSKQLEALSALSELRFAALFAEESFAEHLTYENRVAKLRSLPAEDDPMLARTRDLAVQDGLFIDGLQTEYESFAATMAPSYEVWQKESLTEVKALRKAQAKATVQTVLGGLLVGAAILSSVATGDSASDATAAAQTVGAIAGSVLLVEGFMARSDVKVHRDALAELGESIDVDLAPQVVEFEGRTVELRGNAREQFAQWRAFLQKIHAETATPQTPL